jgi:hypothetical protein
MRGDIAPVVVFGRDSRRTVEEFAIEQKRDVVALRRSHAASGLIAGKGTAPASSR